jgi:hypothetical protein
MRATHGKNALILWLQCLFRRDDLDVAFDDSRLRVRVRV